MKALRLGMAAVFTLILVFMATSGSFLVIDNPQPADVILVLAGETDRRPARALELLSQHLAPRVLLDVPAAANIYGRSMLDLAQEFVRQLPEANSVSICPTPGLSTAAEARDAAGYLGLTQARRVLLVTSDFHTRRALSTFTRELPQYHFSVAASYDPAQFGAGWWRHRQWAKLNVSEWFRLVWWECVDRWR
jgi:hypothetical protein